MTHPTDEDRKRLGQAIEARRLRMGLSQEDLASRGGPSHQTLRALERGEEGPFRRATLMKLERALNWPDEIVKRILDGTATPEELANVWVRDEVPGHAALVVRDPPGFIDTQAVDGLRQAVAKTAPFAELMRTTAAIAKVGKQLAPVIKSMQAFQDGQVAHTARLGTRLERMLRSFPVVPSIDISASLGLASKFRVMAVPPLRISPEAMARYEEFKHIAEAINLDAQPWYSEDMPDEEVIRRGREQLAAEQATTGGGEPGAEAGHNAATDAEVIEGPWGVIVAAQQDLADTDDLALAAELFARVSRRPRSEVRDAQLRVVNGLIAELVEEQQTREDDPSRARGAD